MALAIPWNQIGKPKPASAPHARGNQYSYDTPNSSLGGLSRNQNTQIQPALNFLNTQFAPYTAEMQRNQDYALVDKSRVNQDIAWNTGWANKDYGLTSQLNQLDLQGNSIDRAGVQRLLNPGGVYDTEQTGLNRSRGLLARELANQMRGFDIDTSTTKRGAVTTARQLSSDATARGATVSQGLRDKNSDNYGNLIDQLGQIDVGREGARIGNERGDISLNNQQAGLTENRAQAADRIKQYDIQAQKLGINGQQLKNTLQQGLERLHLEGQVSIDNIMRDLTSKNANTAQQAVQLYSQLLDYGGYIPR